MKIPARYWAVLCLVIIFPSLSQAGERLGGSVMRTVRGATVRVCVEYTDSGDYEINWGSGMVVGPGLVVTNAHVVNDKVPTRITIVNDALPPTSARVVALRYDGNEFTTGSILEYIAETLLAESSLDGFDVPPRRKNYDMAILSFTPPPGVRLPALSFNSTVSTGDAVVAAGFPGQDREEYVFSSASAYGSMRVPEAPIVLSSGSITGVLDNEPRIITHNALCRTGNSGGPLVNARGEILGMQTWTSVPESGRYVSLAIGSRDIVAFLEANGFRPSVKGARGARAFDDGDYDVRHLVLPRAEAGDPDSLAMAGLLHALGIRGFARNDETAAQYLLRAVQIAPNGPNAHFYKAGLAAVMITSPQFTRADQCAALLRSANNSDVVNEFTRHPDTRLLAYEASLYMQGKAAGFQPNPDRSLQLAEKAMEGAFALPFALTGFHYYFGEAGDGRDHALALQNAREAARNGITEGISLLAHLYYDSDVIARTEANRRLARTLAEEAASLGDPWAHGLLALMRYESGVPTERAAAEEMAQQGLMHGNRLAVYTLGRIEWDRYLAYPSDFRSAVKAWAAIELAERQGVRIALPAGPGGGQGIRSGRDFLNAFSPSDRQRLLTDGQHEQALLLGVQP